MSALSGVSRRLVANAGRLIRRGSARSLLAPGGVWLLVRLGPETDERTSPPLQWAAGMGQETGLGLLDVLTVLDRAARDCRVAGVVLRFHGRLSGWSKALALRRAVEGLRESGTRVVAWGESMGAEEYLVASGADRVWLPTSGSLFLVGLRSEQFFVRDLLSNLDVKPEIVRIGGYKSAGELFTRDSMSPEQREQIEGWLDDLYGELVAGIARGRGLGAGEVRQRIDGGPYPAGLAAEAGLIDGSLYPDEIERELEQLGEPPPSHRAGPRRVRLVDAHQYFLLHASDCGWRPLLGDLPRFAYVVASGAIRRGSGLRGIASDGVRQLLSRLGEDPGIRGVVLRVDSPGGDAVASDLIYRAVRMLAREKPVVVSMGDVAASGGYYLAAAADAVFAEVGTVTGSIGVLGGKVNLDGLYRKLGIAKDSVERGARAGLLSEVRSFTPDERGAVKREMESLYQTFLERVAEGRRLSSETVGRLAQGRVWSGGRARSHGLVDAIGGPLEALREVRRQAGLAEAERYLLELFPRRPFFSGLRSLLGALPGSQRW
jgi:protease-4